MKTRKNLTLLFLMLTLFVALGVVNTEKASAAAKAEVSVHPRVVYAPKDSTFTLDINIHDVDDLFTWGCNLSWNPDILHPTNVSEGDFLSAWGVKPTFFVGDQYLNEYPGWSYLGCTIMGAEHGGTDGSGTLASYNFTVVGTGETALNLSEIELIDSWGNLIDFTTEEGFFTNIASPPIADFTYQPPLPLIGETVNFSASASYDPDGEIMSYTWDFGDGESNTGVNVTHSYDEAGIYPVKLTVNDITNLTSTKTVNLRIRYTHDVTVLKVLASAEEVNIGEDLDINATVFNAGTEPETFSVTFYYGENVAGTASVGTLQPDANKTVSITWNTADAAAGDYKIKAVAAAVPGETNTVDNALIDGTVTLNEAPQSFPVVIVAGVIGAIAVVGVVAFLFLRRRGS